VKRFFAFGNNAVFSKKRGDVFKPLVALGIQLKRLLHYF